MTFWQFFSNLSTFSQYSILFFALLLFYEIIMIPFRLNKIKDLAKERNEILREILKETRVNKQTFNDSQAVLGLLLGDLNKKNTNGKKKV